jgi:FkbM family methyltransferase
MKWHRLLPGFLRDSMGRTSDTASPNTDAARLQSVEASLDRLHRKIDLLWHDLEFVRTRLTCSFSDEVALTHLVDETSILVNKNDVGGPAILIAGGRYEESNLAVLLSYLRPDSIFLDVGANLGFFSLVLARRLHMQGHVHAFEPHPLLARLLRSSAYINGLQGAITIHEMGLSDTEGSTSFDYPEGHLGGGAIAASCGPKDGRITAEIRSLDDQMGSSFRCDLVKIDVEGHELSVLKGMENTIRNSPAIKIMFEKLGHNTGSEAGIHDYLKGLGFSLYAVRANATLEQVDATSLSAFSGYVFATRQQCLGDLDRNRLSIYPEQLIFPADASPQRTATTTSARGTGILFHGPYWFLPRGVWQLDLVGQNPHGLKVTVAARFGVPLLELALPAGQTRTRFIAETDLKTFEVIGRGLQAEGTVTIERIDLLRLG